MGGGGRGGGILLNPSMAIGVHVFMQGAMRGLVEGPAKGVID